MKLFPYLRASTKEQDATRAKSVLNDFIQENNQEPEQWFIENESGATLERPALMQLLDVAGKGDVLLIEAVDRLTRLSADNWKKLKRAIEDKGIHIVSLDLPTSHMVLNASSGGLVGDILVHVNNLLLEILATTARKDYEDRRRRQAEGIAKAKAEGRLTGRKANPETVKKCAYAVELLGKGLKKEEAARAAGIGVATLYRYLKAA
ncbi:recombinase family protein [Sansalvadorimonas verongulae]|uniref:recombinase family protein n=1 Tax=Sansalvadorimonas verongulae TaxID=2172824 RepID=UPI002E352E4F|nr:recombinase family protein [Sansalvadorimonas verongulae]MTI13190.1 resolvase [Sansalvadorimonas verongulae]